MKKYNVLIPLAGKGQRFLDVGVTTPKPMIQIDGKSIIEWSLGCVDTSECNLIFVVRLEHVSDYNIDGFLKDKFGDDIIIVVSESDTKGSVASCLLASKHIDNSLPLIIHTSDVYFEIGPNKTFDPYLIHGKDGLLLTFKSNSPNYSYSKLDSNGCVEEVAEKKVISDNASTGVYCFSSGGLFIKYASMFLKKERDQEYYLAPLYNLMIIDDKKIETMPVDKMHIFGTPTELDFFVNNSLKTFTGKIQRVGLCSDHSGLQGKKWFKNMLEQMRFEVIDYGSYSENDCDYVEFVNMACDGYLAGDVDFVFGFCRSGQGINICANKRRGIRAALIYNTYAAEYAIKHNCANFFSIPTKDRVMPDELDVINVIMDSTFDGGRHQARLIKLESGNE